MVTMTVTRCLSSFFSRFLQRMVQEFLALFRFSETGARAISSAYGFHPFKIDRLQSNRPKQAESASKGKVGRGQQMAQPTGPIPIGMHPDFTSGNWRATLRSLVYRKTLCGNVMEKPGIILAVITGKGRSVSGGSRWPLLSKADRGNAELGTETE